jgi:hypothetical protein
MSIYGTQLPVVVCKHYFKQCIGQNELKCSFVNSKKRYNYSHLLCVFQLVFVLFQ